MNPVENNAENKGGTYWLYLKFSYLLVSVPVMSIMAYGGLGCPFPTGICKLYDFAPLFTPLGKPLLVSAYILLCLLYLFEIRMLLTTFLLFLLSNIIISHHESNGIFFRATILTTVWGAQFFAYLRLQSNPAFDIRRFRVQYVIQIIAATYTLAGIAKLRTSGLDWINAGGHFPVQVMKNYTFLYFDTGQQEILERGKMIAEFLLRHPEISQFFLAVSLALELFCLAAAFGAKVRFVFGIGLVLMHIGIAYIMGIGISVIANPMVVFFLNPLYLIRLLVMQIKHKMGMFGKAKEV